MSRFILIGFMLFSIVSCHYTSTPKVPEQNIATILPYTETSSVPGDADDCCIWVHPNTPELSVVIGNDKKDNGALYVWDLQGKLISKTETLNKPVNLDIRYGLKLGHKKLDVIACALRSNNQVKIYTINPNTRELRDITSDEGIFTEHKLPCYGFTLYQRPHDKQLFAFVSSKGPGPIHQIELLDDGKGKIKGKLVRTFGEKDIKSYVEGMCVDDELNFIYCADERFGVLKYYADPDLEDNTLLHKFALKDGISRDREGIALYKQSSGEGFLILSDQDNGTLNIYNREGDNKFMSTIHTQGASKTDGLDATSNYLGPHFPQGGLVCHNDDKSNFVIYDWLEVSKTLSVK